MRRTGDRLRSRSRFHPVEGYVFAHIGGAGLIEGCTGRLLRKRAELGCDDIKVSPT